MVYTNIEHVLSDNMGICIWSDFHNVQVLIKQKTGLEIVLSLHWNTYLHMQTAKALMS